MVDQAKGALSLYNPYTLRLMCLLAMVTSFFLLSGAEARDPEFSVKAPLASQSLLLDGVVMDGSVVVVGERGHILVSEDNGISWTQAEVPTRATLTGVWFYGRKLGWAVGHDQVILRTLDGGLTWKRVYHAPEAESPLLYLWFRDAKNGFAIGAYGTFLETKDAGDTWTSRWISEDDWHLNHITRSANGRLYIAAESGTVYRSEDHGQTWRTLPSPYEGSFFGTLPLQDDSLLLFGLRGHLFRSEDAGNTWAQIKTWTEASLTDGMRLSDGTVIIVGLAGTVLVSTDDGNSFKFIQEPGRKGFSAVMQTKDGAVVAAGDFGAEQLPKDLYLSPDNQGEP